MVSPRKSLKVALNTAVLGLFFYAAIFYYPSGSLASSEELKQQLRDHLNEVQAQINEYSNVVNQKKSEQRTLSREISLLDANISIVQLELTQIDLTMQETELDIKIKEDEIKALNDKIRQQRALLASYMRLVYESDQESLVEIILTRDSFTDFFDELHTLELIQLGLGDVLDKTKFLRRQTKEEKAVIEEQQEELSRMRALQEIQKNTLLDKERQKANLLSETRGIEREFQTLMKKAQQDAASIRNQLYTLEGVGLSMTLEKAYEYAKYTSDLTGVRPAFLLSIIKKESSWGANVGTGNWRADMNPNQHNAFREITSKLGMDPETTPVSKKPWYGWGGAMGPAQFLPVTWLAYEAEVARLTGHNPPNPWHIDDAFVGSAVKLARGGANQKTYEAEWKAAMIYFAGGNWGNSLYRFYGDQVMDLAEVIQSQLDAMGL